MGVQRKFEMGTQNIFVKTVDKNVGEIGAWKLMETSFKEKEWMKMANTSKTSAVIRTEQENGNY